MFLRYILPIAGLASSAAAQEPMPTTAVQSFPAELFELPLHRPPCAEGESDAPLLAVRATYKASFGEAVEFHPFLGSQRERNLPLVWTTRTLRFGAHELPASDAARETLQAWRYERAHEGWSEIYDLRPEGLEQSFAIAERLADGDLVLEGTLRSELRAVPQEYRVGALEFLDEEGELAVLYGTAVVFDASGRSSAVETAFDGERLALRVADAWLDEACFPILVDPLISNVSIQANAPYVIESIEIASQSESAQRNNLIACTRVYSAADHDVYAFVGEEDYSQLVLAYMDASVANSDRDVCVAYVPGADRWVIAHQRDYTGTFGDFSSIRLFFRDRDATTPNAGVAISTPVGITTSYSAPDLGGGAMGASGSPLALLVCRRDATTSRQNTTSSEIVAFPVDAASYSLQPPFVPATTAIGTTLDREHPSINARRPYDSFGWNVCFKESTPGVLGSGRIRVTRLDAALVPLATHTLVADSTLSATSAPRIEGGSQDCLVVYGRRSVLPGTPERLLATTFELHGFGLEEVVTRTLHEGTGVLQELDSLSVAQDPHSGAFWAVAYGVPSPSGTSGVVQRLGGTGAIVESAVLWSNGASVSAQAICCCTTSRGFLVAHGTLDAQRTLYGTRLDYHPQAAAVLYGTACGTATLNAGRPNAGNTQFHVLVSGTPPDVPTFVLISAASAALPLDGLGMTGCVANVHLGAPLLLVHGELATSVGIAAHHLPLPDAPVFVGNAYLQGLYLDPALNGLGIGATQGMELRVR